MATRLLIALGAAVTIALLVADAHIGTVAVWKIVLALFGVALIRFAH